MITRFLNSKPARLLTTAALIVLSTGWLDAAPADAPAWVWWEAEPPNGEANALLSNGQMVWIAPGGSLEKTVGVPQDGAYQLWVRKFWNPQAFRWRAGAGDAWNEVPASSALVDLVVLGAGRQVGWFNAGSVKLTAGSKVFRLEVGPGESGTTAYDCFLLTREPFTPRGALKPDAELVASEPGWFSFQPQRDVFTASPLDLRSLNETTAGEHGLIQARGEEFIQEKTGKPLRFWAVNVGTGAAGMAPSEVDSMARALAKRGVNLVRYHGPIYRSSGANFGEINPKAVDKLHYLIAALKREGIYTCVSIYFPLWVTLDARNPRFPGYTGQHPFALLYFNAEFQTIYRRWWHHLLTTTNPYTGLPVSEDPAVAMLEMVNEDSYLFWTFNPDAKTNTNIPEPQRALLERQFGDWLLRKYSPRALAQIRDEIWGGAATAQDDFAAGRVGFRGLWVMFNQRTRRDQDTAAFLTENQKTFYTETYRYLKSSLGFKGLVYASNWMTANGQYLGPLDKYANTVADFMDRHGYFGGSHTGTDASWSVKIGHTYDDRAAVKFQKESGGGEDFNNPLFDIAYQGQPSAITEVNWPLPNRFRADFPFLAAAYGCLQGSDAVFFFAASAPAWENVPGKFSIQTPVILGQFPATALIYRQGLVKMGPKVVDVQLATSDLFALKGTPLPAPQNFDQLRGQDIPPGGDIPGAGEIDSLAFLVGRVAVNFSESGPLRSRIMDLSPYIQRATKRVRSHSGELTWDYAVGKVTLNAPQAQGVTGFLAGAGTVDLADVTVQSGLEYGAVLVVALDGQPIATARKLLLQVMSEEHPFKWQTSAASGQRTIIRAGEVPVMVRNFSGTVRLKRADAGSLRVTPLDPNGYRQTPLADGARGISLGTNTMYYVIER